MKKLLIVIIVLMGIGDITAVYKCCHKQVVDLPEEYMNMSSDSNQPDTLLGFYDNDIVYITFKGKYNDR